MSAAGFTPIQLYRSTTASAVPTSGNLADGELAINTNDGKLYYKDSGGTVQLIASKAGASGDVVGPASATDNAIVRFDGTTGKLVQNSVVTIADSTGDVAGVGALTMGGNLTLNGGTANGVLYLNGSKVATSGSALTFDGAILGVNGVSVGRGAGAVSSNTAVGASALAANTTGASGVAIGYQALNANTTASSNTAVGYQAAYGNTTATGVIALGYQAALANTTGNYNIFIGTFAGQGASGNITGGSNTVIGTSAGANLTTGTYNTFVGAAGQINQGSGGLITTGSKNTILGPYNGNQGGLDIRTANNYIVLSDGDGNPKLVSNSAGSWGIYTSPSNWFTGGVLEGASFAISQVAGIDQTAWTTGVYQPTYVGTWKHKGGYLGSRYEQTGSSHTFYTDNSASTGAGTDVTWARVLDVATARSLALEGASTQAGTGITFPATQSASSNANTLDDYEEGSWTCTMVGSGGGSVSLGTGYYVKVGQVVYCYFDAFGVSTSGLSGNIGIQGLPFTAYSSVSQSSYMFPTGANNTPCLFYVESSTTNVTLYKAVSGSSSVANFTVSDFVTGTPSMRHSFVYRTNS